MSSPYITRADLEKRLSVAVVRAIYDDDNDGGADADLVAALIDDATSKVDSYLRGIHALPLASVPSEVKRLTLDVAVAYAAQRHPEYVRRSWEPLMQQVERDLEGLRKGKVEMAVPEGQRPPSNQGAQVVTDIEGETRHVFIDGLGDF